MNISIRGFLCLQISIIQELISTHGCVDVATHPGAKNIFRSLDWFFDGNKLSKHTKLTCHFDILIHILSKVFVTFKSQILKLASTDIQIAKEKNQSIVRYSKHSQDKLVEMLMEKDEIIENQKSEINELHVQKNEINERLKNIEKQNNELLKRNDKLLKKNDELIKITREGFAETKELLSVYADGTTKIIQTTLTGRRITTGTVREIFVVLYREKLDSDAKRDGVTRIPNSIVLDTISCNEIRLNYILKNKKQFNEETDRIVFRGHTSNSIDIATFIKEHLDDRRARMIKGGGYIRKIEIDPRYEHIFVRKLQNFLSIPSRIPETITDSIDNGKILIDNYLDGRVTEIDDLISEDEGDDE